MVLPDTIFFLRFAFNTEKGIETRLKLVPRSQKSFLFTTFGYGVQVSGFTFSKKLLSFTSLFLRYLVHFLCRVYT